MTSRVVVIGAGISGLALGWFLRQEMGESVDLRIFESSNRCGGWIKTDHVDGFLFENGPRSCRTRGHGRETLELVEALGISDEVITASPSANRRFLYMDETLHPFPNSFISFLRSPLMNGAIAALGRDLWQGKGLDDDESIASFFTRRIGEKLTYRLIDPLISGIYAGDINTLSMRACFPELYRYEREHGSLLRGMFSTKSKPSKKSAFVESIGKHPIFSFQNGMETLVKALEKKLEPYISLSTPVKELKPMENGIDVVLENGIVHRADHVFTAVSPDQTSRLIKNAIPEAAGLITATSSSSVAVVNLGWKTNVLQREGFGYLIPQSEKKDVLGVVWDSSAFPLQNGYPGQTRLTVMLGGCHHSEIVDLPEDKIVEISLDSLKKQLGIAHLPDACKIAIAREAIPQYTVGHLTRLKSIEESLKRTFNGRLYFLGSAWRGVAVNDCIADARRQVSSLRL